MITDPEKARAYIEKRVDIDPKTRCWNWTGSMTGSGYGRAQGTYGCNAHRLAYLAYKGEIEPGMQVDHICCNKACCNPEHLRVVTRSANQTIWVNQSRGQMPWQRLRVARYVHDMVTNGARPAEPTLIRARKGKRKGWWV